MLLVNDGPSFLAMSVAENPSLWNSFSRSTRFSVQLAMTLLIGPLMRAFRLGSHLTPAGARCLSTGHRRRRTPRGRSVTAAQDGQIANAGTMPLALQPRRLAPHHHFSAAAAH